MSAKHIPSICAKLAFALLLPGLIGLSGCTVGPDFRGVPAKTLAANFLNSPNAESWQSPHLPARPQWHRFEDPKLNQLIDMALVESPNVKELHWRIREASALVAVVSGQLKPFAELGATYERRKRSSSSQPFVGPNGDAFDFFSTGINSQWELDLVGRIRRETQAATAEYQVTVADLHDVRRLLVGEIARTYIRVRLYQDLQRTTRANLGIQSESLESVNTRIAAGKVGNLDLVQLNSRLRLTESDIPVFTEQLKLALNQLAVLVGEYPSQPFFEFVGYSPQINTPLIGRGIPADLIRYRPDIRRSERDVTAETARVGVATAELYPRLSLLGTISIDSRNFSSLVSSDSLAFTIGPSLSWNILSLGRIEKAVEAQKARVEQAIQRYQQTLLTAVSEVENSLVSYHENNQRSSVLREAVENAAKAVELAEDQYTVDKASLERVISNQRRLLRASVLLAETRAAIATASVDLIQATGVGWGGPGTVSQATANQANIQYQGHISSPGQLIQPGHPDGVPVPPSEVPTPAVEPLPAVNHLNPAKSANPLDEPVEGDSDGITELLPLPKQLPPVIPSKPAAPIKPVAPKPAAPVKPAAPIKPAAPVQVPVLDSASRDFWDVEILGDEGIDPDSALAPWDMSDQTIDWPPTTEPSPSLVSEPSIEVAIQKRPTNSTSALDPSALDTTESSIKWRSFRPDPKRDWYATP